MMHELNNIAILNSILNNRIVMYKMNILQCFKQNPEIIHLITIIKNNGFLKIETKKQLTKQSINSLEKNLSLKLYDHKKIAVNTNELYAYIFQPPEIPDNYGETHTDNTNLILEVINR